jgi:hypothetical protein
MLIGDTFPSKRGPNHGRKRAFNGLRVLTRNRSVVEHLGHAIHDPGSLVWYDVDFSERAIAVNGFESHIVSKK